MAQLLPMARQSGLAMEEVADELLVYDLERNRAYCLNQIAALVWRHCDGRTSPTEIARRVKKQLGTGFAGEVNEKVVWYALDQLGRDRLLEQPIPMPAPVAGMSRREHLRALGKVAAIAVPVITAVVAPTPALAVSCGAPTNRPLGCPCNAKKQCQHCCRVTNTCTANCGNACPNGNCY
jgi:hypothetical protein